MLQFHGNQFCMANAGTMGRTKYCLCSLTSWPVSWVDVFLNTILNLRLFSTLHVGHKRFPGEQRVLCWPFASKKLRKTNSQDWVLIRHPGTTLGTFHLRMGKVWFYVSVLEEYKGRRRTGFINSTKWVICMTCLVDIIYVTVLSGCLDRDNAAQRNHALWAQAKPTSVIRYSNLIQLGKTSSDPYGWHWESGTIPFSVKDELH